MKRILVEVDHADLKASMTRLAGAVEDPTPVLKGVGELLRNSAADRFGAQAGPDGAPWAPLQDWYKKTKTQNQDKILTLSGMLAKTLAFQVEGDEVLVGSGLEYAAIHQFGGTIRPKKGRALSVGGRSVSKVTIPARPFLGVSEEDIGEVESLVSEYLADALGG